MPRRFRRLLLIAVAVLPLAACQVQAVVDVRAGPDGRGTVTVALGLDDAALARFGDLGELRVQDMRAAGWDVTAPAKESDGLTWIRASKPFADSAGLAEVVGELSAGALRDFRFVAEDDVASTTRTLSGTVDLSRGVAVLGDPDLASKLDADPFGGKVQEIEAQEGRPVADMVDVQVRLAVADGATQTFPVRFGAPPVAVTATAVETKPPAFLTSWWGLAALAAGVTVLAVMLVGVRRRFAHRRG